MFLVTSRTESVEGGGGGGMGGERSSAKFGQTGAAEGLSLSDSPFLESPDHAKKFSFYPNSSKGC